MEIIKEDNTVGILCSSEEFELLVAAYSYYSKEKAIHDVQTGKYPYSITEDVIKILNRDVWTTLLNNTESAMYSNNT